VRQAIEAWIAVAQSDLAITLSWIGTSLRSALTPATCSAPRGDRT
jgi:hypothetical protein